MHTPAHWLQKIEDGKGETGLIELSLPEQIVATSK